MIVTSMALSAHALAQSGDDLQPRVQTSAGFTAPDAPSAPSAPSGPVPAAAAPQATAPSSAAPAAAGSPHAAAATAAGADRIELGSTEISGNRELPKLLYIVPWQHTQIGQIGGRPSNSLVDEALTPVDRNVFERQNRYYAALQAAAPSAAPAGDELKAHAAPGAAPADAKATLGSAAAGKDEK
jgi:hypothetical protein